MEGAILFLLVLLALLVVLVASVRPAPRGGIRGRVPPGCEGKPLVMPQGGSGTAAPQVSANWLERFTTGAGKWPPGCVIRVEGGREFVPMKPTPQTAPAHPCGG